MLPIESCCVPKFDAKSRSEDLARTKSLRISSPGGRVAVKPVADANVMLSAVLGGRAKAVLEHPDVLEVLTTAVTLAEVQEYSAQLATKKQIGRASCRERV